MNQLRGLIILFISILFSFVNCDDDYIIGSTYTLTWSAGDINATDVDVILYYGSDLTSNWTLITNLPNNGQYDVNVSLTGTLVQFNIPNYSPGQFRLRYKKTVYFNITEQIIVLQPVVLVDSIHGRVTPSIDVIDVYINVSTFLYNQLNFAEFYSEYITLNGDTWTSNCDLNVTVVGTSSPTSSPTPSPTAFAPTTSSPTPSPTTFAPTPSPTTSGPTTASPTPSPITPSPTTVSPTPSPTTQSPTTVSPTPSPTTPSPTTVSPTPSPTTPSPTTVSPTPSPTTSSPTTASPTLPPTPQPTATTTTTTTSAPSPQPTTVSPTPQPTVAPTTASPTTASPTPQPTVAPTTSSPTTASPTPQPTFAPTTASPTTVSPTPQPTVAPTTVSPTIAPTTVSPTIAPTTVSNRKLLSGVSSVGASDYTLVHLQVTVPTTCSAGGPYFLSVGIRNESETDNYQHYTVNAIDDRNDEQYQFINYNASKLTLSVKIGNETLSGNSPANFSNILLYNFSQYRDVELSFGIDSEISGFDYYVVLFNIESGEQYVLACQSQRLTSFSTFGWKASTLNSSSSSSSSFPPAGDYILQIFWSANQDWSIIKPNSDLYQLSPLKAIEFVIMDSDVYPAVHIVKSDEEVTYSTGSSQSIKFRTSFNYSTLLHVYVEQCYNNRSSLHCISYKNEETNFTYTEDEQETTVHIPKDLVTSSSSDKTNLTTRLHVYTTNCYSDSIIDTVIFINVTSNESKKSSNSLSPGAIVGIVSASVLVVGLVAWWLCMRKPADETYRKLDA